jgi:phosphotransferase system HPr-like phosphotransfer protein
MNIQKQEAERILKAQSQANKVTAVTIRKNDTTANKKTELRSMTSLLESKINQGKEVTLIVVESH